MADVDGGPGPVTPRSGGWWPAAALFDLDGTLVDREPLMTAAVVDVMADTARPVPEGEAAGWVGRAWRDIHVELEVEARLGWDLGAWHGRILDAADALVAAGHEVRHLTGGAELVARLHAAGTAVAVVTGSTRREAHAALEALGVRHLLVDVVTSDDYPVGKPDPTPFLLGAERVGVPARGCVVFEDSTPGVAAGLAAGMAVVGVTEAVPPAGDPAHQDLSAAHVVVATLAEVDDEVLGAARAAAGGGGPSGGGGAGERREET